jgi:phage pi2 protein 07
MKVTITIEADAGHVDYLKKAAESNGFNQEETETYIREAFEGIYRDSTVTIQN